MTRSSAAAALVVTCVALVACGAAPTPSNEPWRSAHPAPSGLSFDESAPGLCAFPVRHPAEAPAAIEYQGAVYVQSVRAAPAPPSGTVIGQSGGWTVSAAGGDLYLLTQQALFQYRPETNC